MRTFNNDWNMYHSGCIFFHHGKNEAVTVLGVTDDSEGDFAILEVRSTREVFHESDITNLEMSLPLLGYFQLNKTVVYLSVRQGRSHKKGFNLHNMVKFFPQEAEYGALRRRLGSVERLDFFNPEYISVENITEELTTKDAVIIHRNYAVVKKASHKNPVVYYRREAIAQFVNGDFEPLGDNDSIYVTKLKWELGHE